MDPAMIQLIVDNKDALATICRQFGIKKLDIFGSAANGSFDLDTNDIDFIVDLGGYERGVSQRFFRFADALDALFSRRVDLITEEQIRNPYFKRAVEKQRVNVFNAGDSEAAA